MRCFWDPHVLCFIVSYLVLSSFDNGKLKNYLSHGMQKSAYDIPYFFGYKTKFFSFQNNSKDLDPSCLGRVKLVL